MGLPPELARGIARRVVMPWPRIVVLEEDEQGHAMLYR
jgi:hypothetical protein